MLNFKPINHTHSQKRALFTLALFMFSYPLHSANAQMEIRQGLKPFTEVTSFDRNGVDIASGFSYFQYTDVGIGDLQHIILSRPSHLETYYGNFPLIDNFSGSILSVFRPGPHQTECEAGSVDAMVGNSAKLFCKNSDGSFSAFIEDGSTLIQMPDASSVYTNASGAKFTFSPNLGADLRLTKIEYADGRTVNIHHKASGDVQGRIFYRIQSVTQNDGYQLKYSYGINTVTTLDNLKFWIRPSKIYAVNNAVDYCNPTADVCNFSRPWPSSTHSWGASEPYESCSVLGGGSGGGEKAPEDPDPKPVTECQTVSDTTVIGITNSANLTALYKLDVAGRVKRIDQPDGRYIDYNYCAAPGAPGVECTRLEEAQTGFGVHANKVISVNDNGNIWNYTYRDNSVTNGITDHDYGSNSPTGLFENKRAYARAYNLNSQLGFLQRIVDDETTAFFSPDVENRLISAQQQDSYTETYFYDARGNIVTITRTGVGEEPISRLANFDATCANPIKCNQPNWEKDWRGERTDYTYHSSGNLATVTMPPNDLGVRPQVRYSYEQRYAYMKDSSGNYVQAATPIWMLVEESSCSSGAASGNGCLDPLDEYVTRYEYGTPGEANNLLLKGISVTTRDGTRRTCYRYDAFGNKITETKPGANRSSCD